MKNYNEITKDLLERRERYLAQKKSKIKKIRTISISICSMFLVVVLVLGVGKSENFNVVPPVSNVQSLNNTESNADKNAGVSISESKNVAETDKGNGKNTTKKHSNKSSFGIKDDTDDAITEFYIDGTEMTTKINSKNNSGHDWNKFETEPTTNEEPKWIEKIVVTKKPDKTVYYVGEKFDFSGLQVMGYFTNGVVEDVTKYVSFSSYDADAVSYNYRISVEYTDDSEYINLAATEFYFVVKAPAVSISESNLNLGIGEGRQLSAIIEGSGCDVSWYSTNTDVVKVDASGNVTAVGEGSASVYAVISFKNFTATSNYCQVNVSASVSES